MRSIILLFIGAFLSGFTFTTTNNSDQKLATSEDVRQMLLAAAVAKTYNVKQELVQQIVTAHSKFSNGVFTVTEVMAIIAVESRFKPTAKSHLKRDKAIGLTQIRPAVWKLSTSDLATVDGQVKHGIQILESYHRKLGNKKAAVEAYNVGITSYKKGKINPRYYKKFNHELNKLTFDLKSNTI